jgi:predicted DNA-binding protein with PD1-like motif
MKNETGFLSVEARKGRIIPARLLPGTDLVGGIEALCKKHRVLYGYVGCAIGSLRQATYVIPVLAEDSVLGIKYGDAHIIEGPVELIGGQGVICQSDKGETLIHFHATITNATRQVFGGHFSAGGNPVLATIDLVVVEVDGARMMRRHDPETGFIMLYPEA